MVSGRRGPNREGTKLFDVAIAEAEQQSALDCAAFLNERFTSSPAI